MIAVLVPARNEAELIGLCLASILVSAQRVDEPVSVYVALDDCSDATADIAASLGAIGVSGCFRNVGRARAAAACVAISDGARWLASTDADSRVPEHWLSAQLQCGGDAFRGVVQVDDWQAYPAWMTEVFRGSAEPEDGHPFVHGANLGVATPWYLRAGGFAPLAAHEDVALMRALGHAGARVVARAAPAVITSARRDARAPLGFGQYLQQLEQHALRSIPRTARG